MNNVVGRVMREEEDEARGTMTLVGKCFLCRWKTDRILCKDEGSDKRNAAATNKVSRLLESHFKAQHPELDG